MTDVEPTKRVFMGLDIEGDRGYTRYRQSYVPRPVEELYPYIKDAFDKGVKAITWKQYTPYFNDGEPCEFSVGEPAVTKNPEVAKAWLEENFYPEVETEITKEEFESEDSRWYTQRIVENGADKKYFRTYEEGTYDYEIPYYGTHPDGIVKDELDIPVQAGEFEDALRTAFGDHTQVVVTPERVVQFEYSHD